MFVIYGYQGANICRLHSQGSLAQYVSSLKMRKQPVKGLNDVLGLSSVRYTEVRAVRLGSPV